MSFLYVDDGYTEGNTYFDGDIYIDWGTKVIYVPRQWPTLTQSVPTEIRQLDTDAFRVRLKDLEDDAEGMTFLDTHQNFPPVTVGGVSLARVIEIINGYTVTFEDGQYTVQLIGTNNNIADVTNRNQVSVSSSNSAGLIDGGEAASKADLEVINQGVQKASILIPHTTDLPV